MEKLDITAVILTKDEEKHIAKIYELKKRLNFDDERIKEYVREHFV